jgi:hypothetical protein
MFVPWERISPMLPRGVLSGIVFCGHCGRKHGTCKTRDKRGKLY